MSLMSSKLVKKCTPNPAIYSLSKTTVILPPMAAVKLSATPPDIFLKTPLEQEFKMSREMPKMTKVPDLNPIPPEKPPHPPPLSPDPTPEFPEPPNPDPEIQPPEPEIPVPPNTPGGPEVIPPAAPPEWMPPNPPDIPPPYA